MEPAPRSRPRRASVLGIVVVVAGLVAVVLASRGVPGDRTAAAYTSSFDDRFFLAMFVALVVAGTVLVIWSAWPNGERQFVPPPHSWWRQYLLSLVVLALFVLLGALRAEMLHRHAAERGAAPLVGADGANRTGDDTSGPPASGRATIELGVLVVALAGAMAGRAMARRRATAPAPDALPGGDPSVAGGVEVLAEGVDETDIAAEPDPRRAVRLAYALLERRLDGSQAARPPAATPQEWLGVLLGSVQARPTNRTASVQAARLLTALYERARFADERHPVTPADQETAIEALLTLSETLAEPSTSSGGRDS